MQLCSLRRHTTVNNVTYLCTQHASADVEKMILGNKCDINDKRQVSKDRGEKVWFVLLDRDVFSK